MQSCCEHDLSLLLIGLPPARDTRHYTVGGAAVEAVFQESSVCADVIPSLGFYNMVQHVSSAWLVRDVQVRAKMLCSTGIYPSLQPNLFTSITRP